MCVRVYSYQNVKPITIDQLVYSQQTIAPRHQNKSKRIKRPTTIWKIVRTNKQNRTQQQQRQRQQQQQQQNRMLQFKLYSIDYTAHSKRI